MYKEQTSRCTLNRQTCTSEAKHSGGGLLRKQLPGLFCRSYWFLSKPRKGKRLSIPTVGSILTCLVLQAGSRQAELGWQSLGVVVKDKPSFLLGMTCEKLMVYIHIRRSRCLSWLCDILHLELQCHKINSGSFWKEWVGSLDICCASLSGSATSIHVVSFYLAVILLTM